VAWSLFNKSRCPIGIDFGSHSIKMLQLDRRDEGYAVAAAASRTLPAEMPTSPTERIELISGLIAQMLEGGQFVGQQVVSCLPATTIQYKNLRVPRMPSDELPGAVAWEASDRLKMPSDTTHFQFFDAGEVRQGEELRREIILLAAPHALVDEHVEVLTRCQLAPLAIDAVPGALARCMMFRLPQEPEGPAQMVLDVGYTSSKVLILKDGEVNFFKLIDIGGQKFNQTLAQNLAMPVADAADLRRRLQQVPQGDAAGSGEQLFGSTRRESLERAVFESLRTNAGELAKEVALCLRYYSVTFRGRKPETMLLTGGEAYETQLAKVLSQSADIPVEPVEPLSGMDLTAVPELAQGGAGLSEWTTAAGLSMRSASEKKKRGAA
jgi:type IV pilus assembly protein PilM